LRQPLLTLDDDEALKIADAGANVGQYYTVQVAPVTQAWFGLATVVIATYTGKIAAIRAMAELERERRNAPPAPAEPQRA
jgi:hypothetical protein